MGLKTRQKRLAVIILLVSLSLTFLSTRLGRMSTSSRRVMWLVVIISIRPSCDPILSMMFKRADKDSFLEPDLLY